MTFLSDYQNAIATYVDTYVNVEIRNVTVPGDRLNVNEVGTFEVLIVNNGPVRMEQVEVRCRGLNGTTVKHQGALSEFSPDMTIAAPGGMAVAADGGTYLIARGSDDWHQTLSFRAPASPRRQVGLIEVSIEDWVADLSAIHRRSSGEGATTTYADRVLAA